MGKKDCCNIANEYKKVIEDKCDLERGIWDLLAVILSGGERSYIQKVDNAHLSHILNIMLNNKDKLKEFNTKTTHSHLSRDTQV